MVARKLLNRGSRIYSTGLRGAHNVLSTGLRTPIKMGIIASKGLPIIPGGLNIVNRTIGTGLNTGFGIIRAAPRIVKRGGAILLSPVHQALKLKSPKRKSSERKRPKRKSPKRKSPKRK